MNASPSATIAPPPVLVDIDSLDVSDKWKACFKGIRDLGGPAMPLLKTLPKEDRKAALKRASPSIGSFVLPFVFGFFYYLAKGMWKKGLVLLGIVIVFIAILSTILYFIGGETLAGATRYLGSIAFGLMASRDFYAKKVLGDDGWLPVKIW